MNVVEPPRHSAKVLDLIELSHDFMSPKGKKVAALEQINFSVGRRELVCIIGPSGCGKSTLARIIAGLETQSSGTILIDGNQVNKPGSDRGMVFQSYTLFSWLNVVENIMFGLKLKGMSRYTAEMEAMKWVETVGLMGFERHYPHQLSGGMKQRVAIARALANHPRILVMDEPFGALDAQTRANMQAHLLNIWNNVDVTIVFITHDLYEAVYLADRIIVLSGRPGRVAEIVPVPLARPRSQDQFLAKEFLETKNYIENLLHPGSE